MRRLLQPGGWLVIYNNAFRGEMVGNLEFHDWVTSAYLPTFPSPARSRTPLDDDDATQAGSALIAREAYENEVTFTPEDLVDYLMTQSNIIAAVERSDRVPEDIRAWLLAQVTPLFPVPSATFAFGGDIWFLQRTQ